MWSMVYEDHGGVCSNDSTTIELQPSSMSSMSSISFMSIEEPNQHLTVQLAE